ncbi:sigma-70 family RNA polymerase sigma factor [Thermodesulfobacteriota bacterium]
MNPKSSAKKSTITDPDKWVDLYGDYLYRYALSRIQDPVLAEDLVQETFLAALKARDRFEGRSSEKTWFAAIMKHKIVDHFRTMHVEQGFEDIESKIGSGDEFFNKEGAWQLKPSLWNANPGKLSEQKEFWKILHVCLSELPERSAHAFILREMEGLSTEEICKALEISATNCWVILHRARLSLRHCLDIKWFAVG